MVPSLHEKNQAGTSACKKKEHDQVISSNQATHISSNHAGNISS